MININLKLTEYEWTKLKASKACDSKNHADNIEKYCVNVLLDNAEFILEAPTEADLICPHCHEVTRFQMCCEKCNKIFYEAQVAE